jgi:transcriptional regulator with GAF, ATPase, and Fis domain
MESTGDSGKKFGDKPDGDIGQNRPPQQPVNPLSDVDEAEGLLEDLADDDQPTGKVLDMGPVNGADQLTDLYTDAAVSVTSNLDLRSLVRQILDKAIRMMGASRGILFLGYGGDIRLVPVVALNLGGEELEELERVSRTILQRGQQGEVLISQDAANDDRFKDAPSIHLNQIRSVLCVPLITRDTTVGVLYLDAPSVSGAFPANAGKLMASFASIAAVALENARKHGDIQRENARLRHRLSVQSSFERLLTLSPQMNTLLQRALLGAQVDAPVLIIGESGTGKELLSKSIHEGSPRELNPFIAYNCSTVPRELMESVFFGHVRGAFTGAQRDMPGLLREADRGTLFLNEITDLELELQVKLLDALERGIVRPVGGRREFRVDVRLITATSRDIRTEVREGRFLEDLYYRLNIVELHIPPLRERPEDIPLLVNHFLQKHSQFRILEDNVAFTQGAMEYLQSLRWVGNVNELESLVRRILMLSEQAKIDVARLKKFISLPTDTASMETVPGAWATASKTGQIRPFVEQEREALREALIRTGGNKSKAARLLGLHRNTLLRRIKKLEVSDEL